MWVGEGEEERDGSSSSQLPLMLFLLLTFLPFLPLLLLVGEVFALELEAGEEEEVEGCEEVGEGEETGDSPSSCLAFLLLLFSSSSLSSSPFAVPTVSF